MARSRVEINDAGVQEMYRQVAANIERVDVAFRREWEGLPAEDVEPHVRPAFGKIGLNLPDGHVSAYAAAVSAGQSFEWKLT